MRFAIVGEGPRDEILRWPVQWVLDAQEMEYTYVEVDYSLIKQEGTSTRNRLEMASRHYSPDLIILHRDADGDDPEKRISECMVAANDLDLSMSIACVPVRMTEAWFMFDRRAIMTAAGVRDNIEFTLPSVQAAERMANPKTVLADTILSISGARGRRREKLKTTIGLAIRRVAESIDDYSPLERSRSFMEFKQRLVVTLESEKV